MKQHIEYMFAESLAQLDRKSNDWIEVMECNALGFVVINVSLDHMANNGYTLAILYGIRKTSYTTDKLVNEVHDHGLIFQPPNAN